MATGLFSKLAGSWGRGSSQVLSGWAKRTAQAQVGTPHGFPWPPSPLWAARPPSPWAGAWPSVSLGVGTVLGQGNLRGHQEEDVGLKVYHGLLLGHLGRVLGPGRSVDVKGGVGTSEPLGDGESFDQLEEVLPAGTELSLDPPPSARGGAPRPIEGHRRPSPPSGDRPGPAPPLLRDSLLVLVDGRHIDGGKDVAVHVVGASDVVDVGRVGEQVDRVVGDEVSIDDRDEAQVVQHGVCVGEQQVLAPSSATCLSPKPRGTALTAFDRDY